MKCERGGWGGGGGGGGPPMGPKQWVGEATIIVFHICRNFPIVVLVSLLVLESGVLIEVSQT
eukprot:COSAG05_NODE_849_length_6979_cov_23.287936_1_plen_61_part_10